mgnify:CR=1 FL=1
MKYLLQIDRDEEREKEQNYFLIKAFRSNTFSIKKYIFLIICIQIKAIFSRLCLVMFAAFFLLRRDHQKNVCKIYLDSPQQETFFRRAQKYIIILWSDRLNHFPFFMIIRYYIRWFI